MKRNVRRKLSKKLSKARRTRFGIGHPLLNFLNGCIRFLQSLKRKIPRISSFIDTIIKLIEKLKRALEKDHAKKHGHVTPHRSTGGQVTPASSNRGRDRYATPQSVRRPRQTSGYLAELSLDDFPESSYRTPPIQTGYTSADASQVGESQVDIVDSLPPTQSYSQHPAVNEAFQRGGGRPRFARNLFSDYEE